MKKIMLVICLALLLMFQTLLFAGDTYEQAVSRKVFASGVLYYGTVDMTADSIGNFYTNAMFVGNCNTNNAHIWAVCSNVSGTEDVNVFAQYSQLPDGTYIDAAQASGKIIDALSTTTVTDTINVTVGVACTVYPTARWLSLKFDGQTANPLTTVSWYVFLKFDTPIGSDWVKNWPESQLCPIMTRTD